MRDGMIRLAFRLKKKDQIKVHHPALTPKVKARINAIIEKRTKL